MPGSDGTSNIVLAQILLGTYDPYGNEEVAICEAN